MYLHKVIIATCLLVAIVCSSETAEHHNHIALFGGATIHDGHVYPSIGLDYERYITPQVGVVLLSEIVLADHTQFIEAVGVAFHPIPAVKVAALPGIEISDGHNAFLIRGNIEYAIHAGPVSVSPSVSVDYVNSHLIYVTGVAVGMGF